jgi:hypothetical protein
MHAIDLLPRPARPVGGERGVDAAAGLYQAAGHHGDILLVHRPLLEGRGEAALRLEAACEHHQSGRRLVEPVHDQRIGKRCLHSGCQAVLPVLAAAGHGQQAGGLVDDEQVRIGVNDVQCRLRCGRRRGTGTAFGSIVHFSKVSCRKRTIA